MLYPKSLEDHLSKVLFEHPTKEYRGTPFWAWNTKMTKKHIENTLTELKEMGMGGAHIHSRTGMELPYLGDAFMDLVKYTHKVANDKDMLTWLYDEDRWPSGSAGGLVTKDEKYRIRFLVFSPTKLPENETLGRVTLEASAKAIGSDKRIFLAKYAVCIKSGFLVDYQRLDNNQEGMEGYDVWYAYLEISGSSAWFNNQAYLNTLDKSAVEHFIEVTHEAYDKELGEFFGTTVPAIFTDEPQFSPKSMLRFAKDKYSLTLPYTDDFEDTYYQTYGESFLYHLPEIFWELPDHRISKQRYQYHDHLCERFVSAFADTVGKWCNEHNLLLCGHMMREPSLLSQTSYLGEAMRSYRSFGIPGIDMLCDRRELTTAKQAQSAAHQYNCPGVLCEIYGVTNWDFDFRGHKLAGDWQAALGVTVRVHHLTWTSMAGEAKRDYPAPIGYQSPWYKEYSYIEDYFARLNTALTRGKAEVKVGVIHPIESYWLYWGTNEHTSGLREQMDHKFMQLVKWLLYGLIDFDFISEALLTELQPLEDSIEGGFQVGAMEYEIIVIPNCITLRRTTLERLLAFIKRGGKVIFSGKVPDYIDAVPSDEGKELCRETSYIEFDEYDLLSILLPYRIIDIRNHEGMRTNNILYQMRRDGEAKWLFLAHSEKPANPDIPQKEQLNISIEGLWKPMKYNAITGETASYSCSYENGKTYIKEEVYEHDSLLYYIEPITAKEQQSINVNYAEQKLMTKKDTNTLPSKVKVTLSEPNVYLLDMAEYRFDDGRWNPQEEILRIDNLFREELRFPMRTEAYAQPWLITEKEEAKHKLSLRFHIITEYEVDSPVLALENAIYTTIFLNGEVVPSIATGWYVDRDIQTVALPNLKYGHNILEVIISYHSKTNVENMYLLGDFSVSVAGRTAFISKPVQELAFGDICTQGLPFYGGNIIYEIPMETKESGDLMIEVPQFRCPVIKVELDDEEMGYIAFSPYRIKAKSISIGKHVIKIIAYGNRYNTFGPIHNCNHTEFWFGPNAWRSTGSSWAYEYQLKKSGILVSPMVSIVT